MICRYPIPPPQWQRRSAIICYKFLFFLYYLLYYNTTSLSAHKCLKWRRHLRVYGEQRRVDILVFNCAIYLMCLPWRTILGNCDVTSLVVTWDAMMLTLFCHQNGVFLYTSGILFGMFCAYYWIACVSDSFDIKIFS